MTTPTLSIGIPTFNRCALLSDLLEQLAPLLEQYGDQIEVVVADNASPDRTAEICAPYVERFANFRYYRQSENLGVAKNLVSLFYQTRGIYFMFIGDDDRLDHSRLPRLLELARTPTPPIAFVQAVGRVQRETAIGYRELAAHLIYQYGNAYSGCVDRAAAVQAIESRALRDDIESTVWPQTVMALLAVYDHPDRPVMALPYALGSSDLHEQLNIKTFRSYTQSMMGLIRAAAIIDRHARPRIAVRSVIGPSSFFFRGHLWGALISVLTEEIPRSDRLAVARAIASAGSMKARGYGVLAALAFTRPVARTIYYGAHLLVRREGFAASRQRLSQITSTKQRAATHGVAPGVRYGTYY